MIKKRNKYLPKLKLEILSQYRSGISVSTLAKSYNISRPLIYNWLSKERNSDNACLEQVVSNFVELSVNETSSDRANTLEKASLTFNNVSLIIEGEITSSNLISIIKILEDQRC